MCRMLAISICRREKYFASTMISASFTNSTGWSAKPPKSNHDFAPLVAVPNTISTTSGTSTAAKSIVTVEPLRKKRQSTFAAIKNTATPASIQMLCRTKNGSSVWNEFIVTNPKSASRSAQPNATQSMPRLPAGRELFLVSNFSRVTSTLYHHTKIFGVVVYQNDGRMVISAHTIFWTPPLQVKTTGTEPLRGTVARRLREAARAVPPASNSTAAMVTFTASSIESLTIVARSCEASGARYCSVARSAGTLPTFVHAGLAEKEKIALDTVRLPTLMLGSMNGTVWSGGMLMVPTRSVTSKFLSSNSWKE